MFTTFLFAWAAGTTAHSAGPPGRRRSPVASGADRVEPDTCTACDAASACGWFESSHDLHHGIELTEVEWIDAQLPAHLAEAISFA